MIIMATREAVGARRRDWYVERCSANVALLHCDYEEEDWHTCVLRFGTTVTKQ